MNDDPWLLENRNNLDKILKLWQEENIVENGKINIACLYSDDIYVEF